MEKPSVRGGSFRHCFPLPLSERTSPPFPPIRAAGQVLPLPLRRTVETIFWGHGWWGFRPVPHSLRRILLRSGAQRLPLFRGSVPISPSMRSMGWAVWIRSTFSSGSTSITTRFRSIASPLRSAGETLLPFHFFPRSNCGPTSWGTSPFTDPWDLGSTSTVFPTVPR